MSDFANPDAKGRVPKTLQAVFLASNRGREVKKAPPGHAASRMFRTWFSVRRSGSKKENEMPVKPTVVTPVEKVSRRGSIAGDSAGKGKVSILDYVYCFLAASCEAVWSISSHLSRLC